jgi:O-antigen ligase
MPPRPSSFRFTRPSLAFALLLSLLLVLWLAGGASRADVPGQAVVRTVSWAALIVAALFAPRPTFNEVRTPGLFLSAALALVLVQLIPLPPEVWRALPGRAGFAEATFGAAQPWRSWAIVPSGAWNAASSLVVPAAVLVLMAGSADREREALPTVLLALIALSAFMGLVQFSGPGFNNPFLNDSPGQVSGSFANRNHFALFLAMGCVLAPSWAFMDGARTRSRGPVAVGLVLLFVLTILASGSRAGVLLGLLALAFGLSLAYRPLRRELRGRPRWVAPVIVGMVAAVIGTFVLLSFAADRASSINRIIAVDDVEEMRTRALPTVLTMVRDFFPAGAGFGGFDPLFRMYEPFDLLKLTYFNHAHNDLLEVVLDGGVAALLLLLAAIAWWARASMRVWRTGEAAPHPRLGSALLLLVLLASAFDYPARTPMIMATVAIAAVWLGGPDRARGRSALPSGNQQL